ncbi:MAG: GldG family protein [Acidobacteriota bacterium]
MARLGERAKRHIVSGSMLGAGVVLALALFLIANYFGSKYNRRFDWTQESLFTLSDKTEQILDDFSGQVEIIVFLSPAEPLYGPVKELLSAYQDASSRISVREVDPERNLVEAQSLVDRYEIAQLNVIVFDTGDDRRVVDTADLADYDYSGMQMGQAPTMTGFKGEQVFTSTLLELMESRKPKVVFTTGHGELKLDDLSPGGLSSARELLGQDNFELEEWMSLGESDVPEGTDLVVIAGSTSSWLEPELEMLRHYLHGGGRMLILLDPTLSPTDGLVETGLETLLGDFGVEVGRNIVVDPANPLPFFSAETIFVNVYDDHVTTRALDQAQLPVVLALARSVAKGEAVEGVTVTELMRTSIEGWGETDLENLDQVERDDFDLQGPVSLGVAVIGDDSETEEIADQEIDMREAASSPTGSLELESEQRAGSQMRMIVVGDSDFASNAQLQNMPNATLLANMLNWLVDRETLVGIPPKQPEQVRLSLSRSELRRITGLVLLGLPGLALGLGIYIFLRRRR